MTLTSGPGTSGPGTPPPTDTGLVAPDEAPVAAAPEDAGAGVDLRRLLEETIDAIRPALQADGGDMSLVGVDPATGVVDIELIGACVGCPASTMTLKAGIERILKDRIPAVTAVNAVGLDPVLG